MNIHLITVVGGPKIGLLRQMLEHYRNLQITSFIIHAHSRGPGDPAIDEMQSVVEQFGLSLRSISEGDHAKAQTAAWKTRASLPNDWFVIVDIDEFQIYPEPLVEILRYCDQRDYDHVNGCFLDRIAADGTLSKFNPLLPVWQQYPMGLFFTNPVLGADPRKVVAAKGRVEMANNGHHIALSNRGCPIDEHFIPVHHFKWSDGVLEALDQRIKFVRRNSSSHHWEESQRFIDYYLEKGRIDLTDDRFLAGICNPDYPYWSKIRQMFIQNGFSYSSTKRPIY